MNDEELPVNAELASAYLDDELDPLERAAVDTDPDVMSMVDSFFRVRAMLGEPLAVDAGTRTAAITAALAEFDARQLPSVAAASAVLPASATITSLQSRRMRAYRVVTGVAAALVIGVVAVAALNASRGNDAKSSSASANTSVSAGAAADSATEPQLKIAAETAAPTDASGTAAASGAAPFESASSAGPEIDSRDALKQYAAELQATQAPTAPAPATPSRSSCLTSDQTVLGPIVYQGRAAVAVRKQSTGVLQAVDAIDCHVLAEVAP